MKVVVTGATGNIGTSLVEVLAATTEVDDVVGVARRAPTSPVDGVRYQTADVATDDLGGIFGGADVVVHLAWLFQPTRRPDVTWRVNAVGTARVVRAAVDAGVGAVVHASSVGAYAPAPGQLVDERWPTDGAASASYAREKAYAERVLDAVEAAQPSMRIVRMRPAFVFQRRAASAQRRLFAGPLLPGTFVRPGRLPVVPLPRGVAVQAVHARDVADGFRRAVVADVRGPFNLAAPDVLDADGLAAAMGSRAVPLPDRVVRAAASAAWHLHLVPADPALIDMALRLPLLDTTRARRELGWAPSCSGADALREVLTGMADGAGAGTPPLQPDSPARRVHEVATGIGHRP